MNIQEKRKAFEKLLAGAPEVMSSLQVSTPQGRVQVREEHTKLEESFFK